MEAGSLHCPACGAAAAPDITRCPYCHAALATVACPACFALMFVGAKHCSHCGTEAARAPGPDDGERQCPRCQVALSAVLVGAVPLHECTRCGGLWLSPGSFERICTDAETHARILGDLPTTRPPPGPVCYVRCPDCGEMMNRQNFARISGVIIDLCKAHGLWFDKHELRQVVEFIRNNGMELARQREKRQLSEERARIQSLRDRGTVSPTATWPSPSDAVGDVAVNVASSLAVEILEWLINW